MVDTWECHLLRNSRSKQWSVKLLAREIIYLFKNYKHTHKEHLYYMSEIGWAVGLQVVNIHVVPALLEDQFIRLLLTVANALVART